MSLLRTNVMTLTLRHNRLHAHWRTTMATPQTPRAPPRRDPLNLRIKPEERGLIDRAAVLTGRTRTDFVLDAVRRAAEDALLDRTFFTVSPEAYAAFVARLDAPPQPNARLKRTLQTTPPWE